MDGRASEKQERQLARNRILSRIGFFLIVLSLGSFGVSTFLALNHTSSKLPPNPIVGNSLTPTPVLQPTATSLASPTPTSTSSTPTAISTAAPTTTPTVAPTAAPPPTPSPTTLVVTPTSLDTTSSNCVSDGTGNWVCTVTLTNNSQSNINWSANSTQAPVTFIPQANLLLSGTSQSVTISSIPCQTNSFIFSSPGLADAVVSWNCTTTPTPTSAPIGIIQIPKTTPTPQTRENEVVSNTNISNIKMVSAWPPMTKDQSTEMAVSLVPTPHLVAQLTKTAGEEKTSQTGNYDLIPVGTPGVSIKNAFGSNYLVYASAQLESSSFEINPSGPNPQTLDQQVVSFYWNILPKVIGRQILTVTMIGQWRSQNGGEAKDLLIGHTRLTIEVGNGTAEELFTPGQIQFGTLVAGFLGTALNIPWIYDTIQKVRKKRKSNQTNRSNTSFNSPSHKQRRKRH